MDEVIFTIGRLAGERARELHRRGDDKGASRFLRIMVGKFSRFNLEFPRSRFRPVAAYIAAQTFFETRRYRNAGGRLSWLLRQGGGVLAPWAYHLRGWCRLRLGDHTRALSDFAALARLAKADRRLLAAARRDLVFAYAGFRKLPPRKAFLRLIRAVRKRALAKRLVIALAARYVALGNRGAAATVYRIALRRWPRDSRAGTWRAAQRALRRSARSRSRADPVDRR